MFIAGFDWDKWNRSKCEQHGVSCEMLEDLFKQQLWITPDPKHSVDEDRFLAIGCTKSGRPMFVVFTLREKQGEKFIRPISARFMHAKEVRKYEKAFAKN